MTYSIVMLSSARKSMADLPKRDRIRVDERIMGLAQNPRPPGSIPLKGQGHRLWRLRAGDYRILYQIEDDRLFVIVVEVAHRREVYRGL